MDKKFDDLTEKISQDENLVKEILNIYDFDSLYNKIRDIEPEISKSELEDFMDSLDKNSLPELTEHDLKSVSGGTSNKSRAMATVVAMLMGVTPLLNANATNEVKNSETRDNKTTTQKDISWFKKLGAGALFLTSIFCGKKLYDYRQEQIRQEEQLRQEQQRQEQQRQEQQRQEQQRLEEEQCRLAEQIRQENQDRINRLLNLSDNDLHAEIQRQSKEQLLPLLPSLWLNFFSSYGNVYLLDNNNGGTAYKTARDAALSAAKNAAQRRPFQAAIDAVEEYDYSNCNYAFSKAWEPGGVAYVIVASNNDGYFRNLVTVLVQQTKTLRSVIDQHNTQGSNQ